MSLKKIAEMTGTSISTVSRVLNHPEHRCNSPLLYEQIWKAAAAIKYTPNTSARSLRLGTSPLEDIFVIDIFLTRFDSMDKDIFFKELYQYVKEDILKNGCALGKLLHSVDVLKLENEVASATQIPFKPIHAPGTYKNPSATSKKNSGLIILGKCPSKLIPVLQNQYSYIAGIDRNPTDYAYDEVICNGITAAEKAMDYLIRLGHRNIAYIGDCSYETRYIGYYQTLLHHKLPLTHANVHPTNQTLEEGYHAMRVILTQANRPSAIFCANDSTALGVFKALKEQKKKNYLPSIISIDNIESSQNTVPSLTTIDIPKQEMAHLALMLLLDRKNRNHSKPVRLELPCRLIERESCTFCVN